MCVVCVFSWCVLYVVVVVYGNFVDVKVKKDVLAALHSISQITCFDHRCHDVFIRERFWKLNPNLLGFFIMMLVLFLGLLLDDNKYTYTK